MTFVQTPWDPDWLIVCRGHVWRWPSLAMAATDDGPKWFAIICWIFRGTNVGPTSCVCPFGPILQLVAKKNKKEREKCRFLKISPQIENMSRCRVWWSRPDKLRLPSFEEVDSAVKRLETQRLNLNCLENGCNMKPMETLGNPRGKTENCMKVHHWTCDCNGNAMESTMWNHVEPIWASARICTEQSADNLPCALPAAAPRSGFALFQSQTGSESRSKKTTEKNWSWQVRNPLLRRVWKSLFDVFPVFVPSDDRCTILWSKVWHWYPATDQMNHTQIGRMFANFAMTYNDDLPILEWPSIFLATLELQTATSRKEGPTESRLFGSLKYWTNESVSFLRLLAKVLKHKTILKRTARCTMFVDPQDTFGRPSEGFTLVWSSELVGPVAAEFDFPIRTLKVSHQKCCPIWASQSTESLGKKNDMKRKVRIGWRDDNCVITLYSVV